MEEKKIVVALVLASYKTRTFSAEARSVIPTGLHVLDLIDRGSLEANHALYNNLLRKCTHFGKVKEGRVVHSHIEYSQFKDNLYS